VAGRARLIGLFAKKVESDQQHFSDQAFMVGMLSLADTVVASPMEQILNDIVLSDNIKQAILKQTRVHGQLLRHRTWQFRCNPI
jgi:EAL and modified HD-GYP domain-containing signal transduction protein